MLRRLQNKQCKVKREGEWRVEETKSLVPGDILQLEMGDVVPADSRVLELRSLEFSVDESVLTGEPQEVSKEKTPSTGDELSEQTSMVFMGTSVEYGTAEFVVCRTGA